MAINENLFYFAVNLAADKEIDGTGELMFTLLGQLLITDGQTEAVIPLRHIELSVFEEDPRFC